MPVFGVLEAFRTNAVRSMATLSVCPTGGMNVPTRSDDRAAAEGCGCRHGGWAMGQSQGRQECRPSQGGGWSGNPGRRSPDAPLPWAIMFRPFRPVVRCGLAWECAALECGGKRSATPLFRKGTSDSAAPSSGRRTHVQHPFSGMCCKPFIK